MRITADPGLEARLHAWLNHDPRHRDAYDKAAAVWAVAGEQSAPTAAHRRGAWPSSSNRRAQPPSKQRPRRNVGWAVAASAAVFLLAASAWFGVHPIIALQADHRTDIGEVRQVALSDGSILWLNARTAVSVDFDNTLRRLVLLDGEVALDVAEDPDRPFVISAGDVDARALGTIYSVRKSGSTVLVSVIESNVAADAGGNTVRLAARQAVRHDGVFGPIEVARIEAIHGWRKGRYRFHEKPLTDVMEDLRRLRTGRVMVFDEELAGKSVSGVIPFDAMQHAPWIIADQLGGRVVDLGPVGAVILPRK